jgi:multiple sugar transport system ATP-binding protein
MAEIRVHGLSKSFGPIAAVRDLDLTVGDGDFVVLLGPTGAGKTTTLRLIAGLERPDRGTIAIDGQDATALPPAARDVAFVFQQYSLYPHLSVYDNLAFPLRAPTRRLAEEAIRRRVQEVAELLHIADKLPNKATRLSGGEMQRVALGRALVRQPAAYLMDEPLSSLDAKLRAELRLELKRIQQDLGATVLYVTHDQIEAMTMATHVGVLREGRLVQFGTPREIYEDPVDSYVATRLGIPRINLLPVGVVAGPRPHGAATVGARTEHIRLVERPTNGTTVGLVQRLEHLGDQSHLHLHVAEHSIVVLVDGHSPLKRGDAVGVELMQPLFFDAEGRRVGTV